MIAEPHIVSAVEEGRDNGWLLSCDGITAHAGDGFAGADGDRFVIRSRADNGPGFRVRLSGGRVETWSVASTVSAIRASRVIS